MSKLSWIDGAVRCLGLDSKNLDFCLRWPHDGDTSSCKGPMILCITGLCLVGSVRVRACLVLAREIDMGPWQWLSCKLISAFSILNRAGNSASEVITSEHAHPPSPSSRMALFRDPRRGKISSGTSSVSRPQPANGPILQAQPVTNLARLWADPPVFSAFDAAEECQDIWPPRPARQYEVCGDYIPNSSTHDTRKIGADTLVLHVLVDGGWKFPRRTYACSPFRENF